MITRHSSIREFYDRKLQEYGDTPQGAAWPNEPDRLARFAALTEPILHDGGTTAPMVLDLGCGTGELLRFLRESGHADVGYVGVDISELPLSYARAKFPEVRWVQLDVLEAGEEQLRELSCDWLIASGLFTLRHDLAQADMWRFMTTTLQRLWPYVRRGIAFNVMSKVVDWERDDLFHVSHDDMAGFLHGMAGRRIQMRADYGLYEYACFAFKPEAESRPQSSHGSPSDPTPTPSYRPKLPTADRLLPYLRRIDQSRIYSNRGPLLAEFERRLCVDMGLGSGNLLAATSGTAALVGGILASAGRATTERPYALCPSYTFVGTASALQQCGYIPWLVDVDADTWMLDPAVLAGHAELARVGLILPVGAMGRPLALGGWARLRDQTGVPVLVDGAACLEALASHPHDCVGDVPVALSFHATKTFATGEGGALVCRDHDLLRRAFQCLNFGFMMTRESAGPSTNGKMSEYQAAVGLASLDQWPDQQAALHAVADHYRAAFAAQGLSVVTWPQVASNYVVYIADDAALCRPIIAALAAERIETRFWYGPGLHDQPAFAQLPHDALPVTADLASRLLGLPVAPDLDPVRIDAIARIVRQAIDGRYDAMA